MSETKHTPEPWTTRTITFKSAREVLDDLERMLANGGLHNFTITTVVAPDTLPTPPPTDSDGTVIVAYLGNGPTAPVNARLIAAAPELLEAAMALAGRWLKDEPYDLLMAPQRALVDAIKKARGES